MKAAKRLHVALLLLSLLSFPEAQAFYNPTTGRWLSRDPIAERAANNLYGFLSGNAVSGTDRLGLWRDPDSLYCYCRCLKASVTFEPGQSQLQWGWHNASPDGSDSYMRFGNHIHVQWIVLGKPSQCSFYQDESAEWYLVPDPPGDRALKRAHWTSHKVARQYTDYMGAIFRRGLDDGGWTVRINKPMQISLRCVSSDGGPAVVQPVSVPNPPAQIDFPPT